MAQVTEAVARGILEGQGYTDNEVRQLAHAWLAARGPGAAAGGRGFRVSVEPLEASNGVTYVVCLDSPHQRADAAPWDSGRITPINRNDVDEANSEGERWAKFLGASFTPCTAVEGRLPNTVPQYGQVFKEATPPPSPQQPDGSVTAVGGGELTRLADFLMARQSHLGARRSACWDDEKTAWDDYEKAANMLRALEGDPTTGDKP